MKLRRGKRTRACQNNEHAILRNGRTYESAGGINAVPLAWCPLWGGGGALGVAFDQCEACYKGVRCERGGPEEA